jgi:hypothetical protein
VGCHVGQAGTGGYKAEKENILATSSMPDFSFFASIGSPAVDCPNGMKAGLEPSGVVPKPFASMPGSGGFADGSCH